MRLKRTWWTLRSLTTLTLSRSITSIKVEDFLKNIQDNAKEAAEKAAEKLGELKDVASEKIGELTDAASEKLSEWSEKAEAMAAEAKAEAAAKLAEAQAAKEKIAAHEGGALGFLSDKAKELLGEDKDSPES